MDEPRDRERPAAPVLLKASADLTTPVRAFLTLTDPFQDAFLLESVAGGESQARYSFLGFSPAEIFDAGETARVSRNGSESEIPGPPERALEAWARSLRGGEPPHSGAESLPPFLGGAVGWVNFSAFAWAEPKLALCFKDVGTPKAIFGLFHKGVVFDHLRQEITLFHVPGPGEEAEACRAGLALLLKRLEETTPASPRMAEWSQHVRPDRVRFSRNFAAVKEAIASGDSYQIVISEGFEGDFEGDPFTVYRRLRRLNPSPYHFYISLGGRQAVGASPEMLVRVDGKRVATVPIAGTRPRGESPAEDRAMEEALKRDPKELAEHAMLVDLARNDLGRVCLPGSVVVPVQAQVERFSHVMHLVSEVEGVLAPGKSALDALWAAFPAGTVSGAPKIRAVEILSSLEGEDRGLYAGAVGFLDLRGNLETCIAIRTLFFEKGKVRFRAGAGIVADSEEESEFKEIHQKAGALLQALSSEEGSP